MNVWFGALPDVRTIRDMFYVQEAIPCVHHSITPELKLDGNFDQCVRYMHFFLFNKHGMYYRY